MDKPLLPTPDTDAFWKNASKADPVVLKEALMGLARGQRTLIEGIVTGWLNMGIRLDRAAETSVEIVNSLEKAKMQMLFTEVTGFEMSGKLKDVKPRLRNKIDTLLLSVQTSVNAVIIRAVEEQESRKP